MKGKNMNFNLICLDSVDSTNKYLKSLNPKNELEEGTVIMAEYQNAGKGQGKNTWHSEKGKNLLISVLFKPSINAGDHFMISEFISLGIVNTLALYDIKAEIKWPNDIYCGDKKIAGLLVENSLNGKTVFQTIAGIGLNVNESHFPNFLSNPTSLYLQTGKEVIIKDLLNVLMDNLFRYYELIKEKEFQHLHDEYNSLLYRKNITSRYISEDHAFNATLLGVSKSGELQLKTEDGHILEYLFGEVHMVI